MGVAFSEDFSHGEPDSGGTLSAESYIRAEI
jgi:hypothetical protein